MRACVAERECRKRATSIEPELIASGYGVGVKTVQERVEDAMREVGTLLITFAPLDAALAEGSGVAGKFLSFVIVGVTLFAGSLWLERRRTHDG
jgi:hypothetical protein